MLQSSLLGCMQALRREDWEGFTAAFLGWGKDRRGAEASGVIVWDSFSPQALSIVGVPSIVLISGPSGTSPSEGRDRV